MPQKPEYSSSQTPAALSSLLLEIGTEEVPARFLPLAMSLLKNSIESRLTASAIGFTDVQTFATPRRISALVRGIPPLQREVVKEGFGPAKKIAFDSGGNPTKAAIGFAQSQGITVEQLSVRHKDKGEYRRRAGEAGYPGGFVEHYVLPLLYPAGLTPGVQAWLGAFVVALNAAIYAVAILRWRRSRH